jgi:hypothetical protein
MSAAEVIRQNLHAAGYTDSTTLSVAVTELWQYESFDTNSCHFDQIRGNILGWLGKLRENTEGGWLCKRSGGINHARQKTAGRIP